MSTTKPLRKTAIAWAVAAIGIGLGSTSVAIGQAQPPQPPQQPQAPQQPQPPQQSPEQQQPAQQPGFEQPDQPARPGQPGRSDQPAEAAADPGRRASELEGMRVINFAGQELGYVDSVAFDVANGEIAAVAVTGADGALRLVPPGAIRAVPPAPGVAAEAALRVDMDRQQWAQIPPVERGEIAQIAREEEARELHQRFGMDFDRRPATEFGAPDRTRREETAPPGFTPDVEPVPDVDTDPDIGAAPGRQTPPGGRAGFPEREFGAPPGQERADPPDAPRRELDTTPDIGEPVPPAEPRYGEPRRGQRGIGEEHRSDPFQQPAEPQYGEPRRGQRGLGDRGIEEDRQASPAVRDETTALVEERRAPRIILSTDLRQHTILNPRGEELATIDDVMLDLESGTMNVLMLRGPDQLGAEAEDATFAVSPHALSVTEEALTLDATVEQFAGAEVLAAGDLRERARGFAQDRRAARERPEIFRADPDDRARVFGERPRRHDPRDEPGMEQPGVVVPRPPVLPDPDEPGRPRPDGPRPGAPDPGGPGPEAPDPGGPGPEAVEPGAGPEAPDPGGPGPEAVEPGAPDAPDAGSGPGAGREGPSRD